MHAWPIISTRTRTERIRRYISIPNAMKNPWPLPIKTITNDAQNHAKGVAALDKVRKRMLISGRCPRNFCDVRATLAAQRVSWLW